MLGDVMFLHHHSNLSRSTPTSETTQHRVAFLGLSGVLVKLLQALVPSDMVHLVKVDLVVGKGLPCSGNTLEF